MESVGNIGIFGGIVKDGLGGEHSHVDAFAITDERLDGNGCVIEDFIGDVVHVVAVGRINQVVLKEGVVQGTLEFNANGGKDCAVELQIVPDLRDGFALQDGDERT